MTKLIGAKFEDSDARLFQDFCEHRGETVTTALKRLVFLELGRYGYLEEKRKQALGVDNDRHE